MENLLAWIAFAMAAVPAFLFLWNLALYSRLKGTRQTALEPVSVLIPARNEEKSIRLAVESVQASQDVAFEVIVLDDQSEDATREMVQELAAKDSRVRCEPAPALPAGWCGKQHACAVLARLARYDTFCFLDADVRLAPDALARMAAFLHSSRAGLISGFPREVTGSQLEKLVIPLIHFVLLGFLPIAGMRASRSRAFAAGCGQLMMVRRDAYERAGGHASIRTSLHDGLMLPKSVRTAGFATDLFDATDAASCRMYTNARETWQGLAKNATEGLASPWRILPFTLLLFGGQVLPFVLVFTGNGIAAAGIALAWLPRFLAAWRFQQSWKGALLHPAGVLVLLAIQWYALITSMLGRPAGWKGRTYVRAGLSN